MAMTLTEDYLTGRGGDLTSLSMFLSRGQRLGQAFFNALSYEDQARLRGRLVDPFYKDDQASVHTAIEWLLDHE